MAREKKTPRNRKTRVNKYGWATGKKITDVQTLPDAKSFTDAFDARCKTKTGTHDDVVYELTNKLSAGTEDAYLDGANKVNLDGFVDGGVADLWAKRICERANKAGIGPLVVFVSSLQFNYLKGSDALSKFCTMVKRQLKIPNEKDGPIPTGKCRKVYIKHHLEGGHFQLFVVDLVNVVIRCYDGFTEDLATQAAKYARLISRLVSGAFESNQPFRTEYYQAPPFRDNCCAIISSLLILYDIYDLSDMVWHSKQISPPVITEEQPEKWNGMSIIVQQCELSSQIKQITRFEGNFETVSVLRQDTVTLCLTKESTMEDRNIKELPALVHEYKDAGNSVCYLLKKKIETPNRETKSSPLLPEEDWYKYWRCRIAYELVTEDYGMINQSFKATAFLD